MTEEEWLACENLLAMWDYIENKTSNRKVRLFGCAVFQFKANISTRLTTPDDDCYDIVTAAEQYADGILTDQEMAIRAEAIEHHEEAFDPATAYDITQPNTTYLRLTTRSLVCDRNGLAPALFHDLFGNPFRPVTFSPSWRTSTLLALAAQMYESRDFGAMPILGDALQDAGCDSADVLDHCRKPGLHVRGCWVVDLVLGKG